MSIISPDGEIANELSGSELRYATSRSAKVSYGLRAEYHRLYYYNNKLKIRAYERKHLYGLSNEDYQQLLADQAGRCAICKQLATKLLHVDHNHTTGRVRGLLCQRCNLLLGSYEKVVGDREYLEAISSYLLKES
jgi:hypothetical protein